MATSKPISTISFNSERFLRATLDQWVADGKLKAWFYIRHYGESNPDDEVDKKDHFHLRVVPARPVDFVKIQSAFVEPVIGEKPLRCMPFQRAELMHWWLYCQHYEPYLRYKGMERMFHYRYEEFVSSDPDYARFEYTTAMREFRNLPMVKLAECAENGENFAFLVASGQVPISQIGNARLAYQYIQEANLLSKSLDFAKTEQLKLE